MKTLYNFEIAGGSVAGTNHVKKGINNQDYYSFVQTDECIVAIVSDGCGSCKHSEVGSKIQTNLLLQSILTHYSKSFQKLGRDCLLYPEFWKEIEISVLHSIKILAEQMGNNLRDIIANYFLATCIGVLITEKYTQVFSCGDGVYILNGEQWSIGPFEGNMPPYLAYAITGSSITDKNPDLLGLSRKELMLTKDVHSLLLGTDGVEDLIKKSDFPFPGQERSIGDISQFWEQDRYFQNPQLISNTLRIMNAEKKIPQWKEENILKFEGLLPDDTTLLTIRKKKQDENSNN